MEIPLKQIVPDAVPAGDVLYVADRELRIVYTNDSWRQFATSNKGTRLLGGEWNTNLLENMSGKEKARWTAIYRLLLDGRLPQHEERFICSSPVERRIYRLRITPERDASGTVRWLVHHTARIHDEAADAGLKARLRQLDESPERVEEDYRRHVLARRIRIPRYAVAQHLEPVEQVGGDVLWHRPHGGRVTDLVHADVVGHGTAAAREAAKMVHILDHVADAKSPAAEVVSRLNRAMLELHDGEDVAFATGLYFRFTEHENRLTCVNFGHCGPIFSRSGLIYLDGGLPVGMVAETEPWPRTELDLAEHGERFLVFSDGITEQFNLDGEMFDTARLLHAFRECLDRPLDELLQRILDDLATFRGDALIKDDQCLLALELLDRPSPGTRCELAP